MKYERNKHHRRSIRLPGYNYRTPGAYFITICSWQRECLFDEVIDGIMQLSPYGKTVLFNWSILPKRYQNVALDNFIVMPNHIHGIILLKGSPEINNTEEESLFAIREYIINNPFSWGKDELYPHNSVKINESSPLSIKWNGKSYIQSIVL
jgi:putative transposase